MHVLYSEWAVFIALNEELSMQHTYKIMPHYFIQSIHNEKILGQISVLTINLKVGHFTIIMMLEKSARKED